MHLVHFIHYMGSSFTAPIAKALGILMSERALCIKCYEWKKGHMEICMACRFIPQSDEDICKSRMLDQPWAFQDPTTDEIVSVGKTREELETIFSEFRSGNAYSYPEYELNALTKVFKAHKTNSLGVQEYLFLLGGILLVGLSVWLVFQ